jgi:hypothetical protein
MRLPFASLPRGDAAVMPRRKSLVDAAVVPPMWPLQPWPQVAVLGSLERLEVMPQATL